jgi:hypothetical protein
VVDSYASTAPTSTAAGPEAAQTSRFGSTAHLPVGELE